MTALGNVIVDATSQNGVIVNLSSYALGTLSLAYGGVLRNATVDTPTPSYIAFLTLTSYRLAGTTPPPPSKRLMKRADGSWIQVT
jgi:hypothetical protein